jgi:hypothetical protein
MKTRQEHLQWCKDRANEYIKVRDGQQAISSMLSDLNKHEETRASVRLGAMLMTATDFHDMRSVKRFVDGFN